MAEEETEHRANIARLILLAETAIERYGDDYSHAKYVKMAEDLNQLKRALSGESSV